MLEFKTMTIEDIIEWCQENNKTEWLKTYAAKKINGKAPTYFQIRKAFCTKFMPEILPVAKPKAKTMYDKIAAL